jgi:Uma2 family endonuclease
MSVGEKARAIYPDSDGQPMAENTLQFDWIVRLKEGLDDLFRDRDDVFVAGDLLWYPVEGDPLTRIAPDAMVAFGRPKGYRGSYRQWSEGGVAPQVVFEVLSPGNRASEMARKLVFYERFGVEEYYLYDPDRDDLTGWVRDGGRLTMIDRPIGWTSPRLGVRFEQGETSLRIIRPDGRELQNYEELARERDELASQRDELARKAERLAARLRELGEDPDR